MKSLERALDDVKAMFLAQQARGRFGRGQLVVRQAGRLLLDESVGEETTGDTPFQVMSASKAVVAVVVAMLEAQDRLDVERPIASFWPEFAANGKKEITVLDVLTHRSGVLHPELDAHPDRWLDWAGLTATIAQLPPTYRRGTPAYNPLGFGWILAEIARRVTGASLPELVRARFPPSLHGLEFLRTSLAAPAAPTLWRGGKHHRVGGQDIAPMFEAINNQVSGVKALVPGAGMFTSARTLALFYDTLVAGGVTPSGERLVAEEVIGKYTQRTCAGWDRSVRTWTVLGRGFALGWRGPHPYGWWNTGSCFGHPGGYSVVAWGDPRRRSAVAITTDTNRSLPDLLGRCAPLGSAIARALASS
jgi:CubicO group peptidase (beta-lactamase class C family)